MDIIEKIKEQGIIPVVTIKDASKAVDLSNALISGGLESIEVTFRTDEAKEAIKKIKEDNPSMLVAAGTVLSTKQVDEAIESGADFIVSPGSNFNVIQYCIDKNVLVIPGVVTPSEIEQNLEMGIKVMKFFPAEAMGGINTIKAISAPYKDVLFMPTGGISLENAREYLKFSNVLGCGGSFMVKEEFLDNEDFENITKLAKKASNLVKEMR